MMPSELMIIFLGLLVIFAVPGFAMIEAGMTRVQNNALACLKAVMIFVLAGASYALLGADIALHGLIGGIWKFLDLSFVADAPEPEFFFQMMLVVSVCLIIVGPVAERVRLWPLLFFCCVFAGIIFPLLQFWMLAPDRLPALGFSDPGGVNTAYLTGGVAALMAIRIAGSRPGRYSDPKNPQDAGRAMPGANMPLAALGTLMLWLALAALQVGMHFLQDLTFEVSMISRTLLNTYLGSAGGAIAAFWLLTFRHGKADLTLVLNALLAGLVAVSGIAAQPYPLLVFLVGGMGGVLCLMTVPLLDRMRLDDVTGAISVFGTGGFWAMLVASIFKGSGILGHLAGLIAITGFTGLACIGVLTAIKATIGICCSERESRHGQDAEEVGVQAYPQFEIRRTGF